MKVQFQERSYSLGNVYSEQQIKDFKEKLEIEIGAKISRTTVNDQIRLICKECLKNQCKFLFRLIKITMGQKENIQRQRINLNQKQMEYYQLVQIFDQHKKSCYLDLEQHNFFRNRKQLLRCRNKIQNILSKGENKINNFTPSEVLKLLAEQLEKNVNFIYEGFQNNSRYRRQIKKKFDNIIAEIKKKLGPKDKKKVPIYIVEKGLTPNNVILKKLYVNAQESPKMKDKNARKGCKETLEEQQSSQWQPKLQENQI